MIHSREFCSIKKGMNEIVGSLNKKSKSCCPHAHPGSLILLPWASTRVYDEPISCCYVESGCTKKRLY